MAGDTVITVIGNITGDPELRFTPSGAAVANFTVASTPRQFDRQSNEWKEGEKRTVVEMEVDEVGPSLRYATAKVNRTQRGTGGGGFSGGGQGGQGGFGGQQDDPWATGPSAGSQGGQQSPQGGQQSAPQGGGWGAAPSYVEPPF